MAGLGDVSWVDLALDYKAFAPGPLLASLHHKLLGMRLGELARVLCLAARLVHRHMAGGPIVV